MAVERVFIRYEDEHKGLAETLKNYLRRLGLEVQEENKDAMRQAFTAGDAILVIQSKTLVHFQGSPSAQPRPVFIDASVPIFVPVILVFVELSGILSAKLGQRPVDEKVTVGDDILAQVQTALARLSDSAAKSAAIPATETAPGASPGRSVDLPPQAQSGQKEQATNEPQESPVIFRTPTLDDLANVVLPPHLNPFLASVPRSLPADDVRFTAFRPERVIVEQWQTLLVYAHLESALEAVRADARLSAEKMGQSKASAKLARGTAIRIVPRCEGVTFNPESVTLKWLEDLHRADFRFRAEASLAETDDLALVDIYVGPLIIGQVKLALSFENAPPPAANPVSALANRIKNARLPQSVPITASLYRQDQIFVSYSHADTSVAVRFRNACKALGFEVLIDIDSLRAGEVWNDALMRMIEQADLFQLFWSERAASSPYVRQEWQYARELQKKQLKPADFIRPVHWESPNPVPPPPDELSDLHFAYVPLSE